MTAPRSLGVRFTILALVACGFAAVSASLAAAPPAGGKGAKPAPADKKALIERGKYLTTIMGCNDCHTPGTFAGAPDFSRQLSGTEYGWQGPWGVTFASNLTPDPESGLGYWSEDEIVKAFRSGVKNDGKPVMPPMPWQDFSVLNDADAHAIATYLMSLPPVQHKVPDDLPPGQGYSGATIAFPPPSKWDTPPAPPADAGKK
ncbi:MAG TPA: c-type cytochrome [Candidatus Acidoferrales bacterium]|nr:c-type cytochrome [Candidatus Acidoferrales bacterium]